MSTESAPDILTEAIVAEHGDYLFGYAKARLRRREAAEDAVQETLLAVVQRPADFAAAPNPRAWLVGILRHKIVDQFRRGSRETPISALADDDEEDISRCFDVAEHWIGGPVSWKSHPGALLRDKRFLAVFRGCLDKLPGKLGSVFVMREVDGEECEEVCETLNITSTNLYASLHRARFRLRACVEKHWLAESTRGKE